MSWHSDPECYLPVSCSHCLDHAGRPTGYDPDHPDRQCPICKGMRKVDPDKAPAPEPGHQED